MNFRDELAERAKVVNKALDQCLPSVNAYPPAIHQAVRYSVFAGGKRLRPILVLAGAEAVGGNTETVMPAACAVELLHTYSLVHDDLPAMDNDDLRRGQPTCHRAFGEAMAILAGDALLTSSFNVLAQLPQSAGVAPERVVRVISELAQAAGTQGLIGGQVVDLASEGDTVDEDMLEYIHTRKTGALIRVSVRAGAILSGASEAQLQKLTDYANSLGLAFQIVDDILDVVGDEQIIGKPVGSDQRNQKATYPALFGLDAARQKATEAAETALSSLNSFGSEAQFLRGLVQFVINRNQ
ncbi:MAG: hypothetical protein VR67_01445 [Peptococcaceae bacterium BRH_c8a]|nr:MAG: hypothetical protein VR67_01445 [Peptococcaceae bacterium BRH_c8a]